MKKSDKHQIVTFKNILFSPDMQLTSSFSKKKIIGFICFYIIYILCLIITLKIFKSTRLFSLNLIPIFLSGLLFGIWAPIPVGAVTVLASMIVEFSIFSSSTFLPFGFIPLLGQIPMGMGVGYLKAILLKLKRSEEELARTEQEKTDFFINLAHETKMPLTLITNYLDKYIEEHEINDDLKIIRNSFEKLKRDMLNFLDQEKLLKGMAIYDHNQVSDFSGILTEKLILYKETLKTRDITLKYKIDDNIVIKADPDGINRIINNLLSNAYKYTERRGEINISLKSNNKNIVFSVKDTGIGMSKEQLKNIFERYYQISHKKLNIQGIGMGLNITKKIVEDIGGTISVESEPDAGSEFIITLKKYIPTQNDIISDKSMYAEPLHEEIYNVHSSDFFIEGRHNILVVEDNANMLAYLKTILKEDYNIYCAANGAKAISILKTIPEPDLIISDIMMDEMDGHTFYKMLIENKEYKSVPFIFLTAKNSIKDKLDGLKTGAVDYIGKPFNINELKARIKSLLDMKDNIFNLSRKRLQGIILNAINNNKNTSIDKFEDSCNRYNISLREKAILSLIIQGLMDKEIAHELEISYNTVRTHIAHVFKKCSAQNRVELVSKFKN